MKLLRREWIGWLGAAGIILTAPLMASGQERSVANPTAVTQRQANAPFAAEIAAFETADKKQFPAPGGVLFIGSSSIRFWTTLAQDFPELPVLNRGFGGSQIADSVYYADRIVFPYQPKMIVMYAGTNDLNAGKSPAQVLKDFQAFEEEVHRRLPDIRIIYISINPSIARWNQEDKALETNRLIRKFIRDSASRTRKLSFVDSHKRLLSAEGKPRAEILRPDGLHLNAEGYKEWTSIVKPQILALWKADTK
jgi:lysophospholipase L1-like esterase